MNKIKIGGKTVGYGEPCFIIAEAGVNHNGELEKALKLIDIAADSGADAVKFQTFRAEQVVTESGEMAEYQKKNLGHEKSQREMLRELELNEEFYPALMKRAKEKNIIFFSTPHGGKASVDFLESVGVPLYKVGSGDLTNYLLLRRVAQTGKPVILSSGMATMEEVKAAIAFIRKEGAKDVMMLHCTTNYPCPPEEANLNAMVTMMHELDAIVGYSDHSEGPEGAMAAAAFGAAVYERHFTVDKFLPGPDHIASDSPEEFAAKVAAMRRVALMLGSAVKAPVASEMASMKGAVRRSIVAARDLPAGQVIKEEDLEAKRPGGGISPAEFEKLLGKKLKRAVKADEMLSLGDVE